MSRDTLEYRRAPSSLFEAAFPVGVATAVAMWTSGFIARLPFIQAHPAMLFGVLAVIMVWGGRQAALRHPRHRACALYAALVAGTFDLLVLGSFLAEDLSDVRRTVMALTGLFTSLCLLAMLGAWTVSSQKLEVEISSRGEGLRWLGASTFVASMVMIAIGGLVTSEEAGMAVPDWPASFGENMFLLRLSRMTGGIYYEHAHRLYGTLVGLVTLSFGVCVFLFRSPKNLRILASLAVIQVIFQGILGGGRVTEVESAIVVGGQVAQVQESGLSLALRVFHGVDGQLFLALTAVLWLLTSKVWNNPVKGHIPRNERFWSFVLLAGLTSQLTLGALSRHVSRDWMIPHIVGAFVVLGLVFLVSARCSQAGMPAPRVKIGVWLGVVAAVQVTLGFYALAVTGSTVRVASSGIEETLVATAHQSIGAVLLTLAGLLLCWTYHEGLISEKRLSGTNFTIRKTS